MPSAALLSPRLECLGVLVCACLSSALSSAYEQTVIPAARLLTNFIPKFISKVSLFAAALARRRARARGSRWCHGATVTVEVGGEEGLTTSSHVGDQLWRCVQQHHWHAPANDIRGQTSVIGGGTGCRQRCPSERRRARLTRGCGKQSTVHEIWCQVLTANRVRCMKSGVA